MNNRRFNDKEVAEIIKKLESTTVAALSAEIGTSIHTIYSAIRRYEAEQKFKKQVDELKAMGNSVAEIIEKLEIGEEEAEKVMAHIEGRKVKRIIKRWTPEQREEMWKCYCLGATAAEIAATWKTKTNKIYNQLERHKQQLVREIANNIGDTERKKKELEIASLRGVNRLSNENIECIQAEMEILKPKEEKKRYKGQSIAEINRQAKMHNLTYGQYIAMKEMGLCQES